MAYTTDEGGLPRVADGGRPAWLRRVGLLNDYVRIPYANGSSFASQFLYRELSRRGLDVTVVGPDDPSASAKDLPRRHYCLPSVPLRNHPGVHMPLPSRRSLRELARMEFDVVLGQSATGLLELGAWLRRQHGVPFLCVNTVHLPSVYNVMLPDRLNDSAAINSLFAEKLIPWLEGVVVDLYNRSDGLIVLSENLEEYWRSRGVVAPITVIPRSVEPKIFDAPVRHDAFDARARKGLRLLSVCRHTREKGLSRLIEIFARWVAPAVPDSTLTLVGDGPDHDTFRREAARWGVADRVFFPGEYPVTQVPAWYRNADLFLYTSKSETYGQVVSEALWCGLPTVALYDGMGVSHQVKDGLNGVLVHPSTDADLENWRFGSEVVSLLRNGTRRRALAEGAVRSARERSQPDRCIERYYGAFEAARRYNRQQLRSRLQLPTTHVARWASLHLTVAGLGLLRPPAVINRHGRRQPSWDDLAANGDTSVVTEISQAGLLRNLVTSASKDDSCSVGA